METLYRIKITLGDLSFELESHDKSWLQEKEKYYLGEMFSNPKMLESLREKKAGTKALPKANVVGGAPTINEFYRKFISGRNLTRNIIALLMFYYVEKIRKDESITTKSLKIAFKEIAYPKYDKVNYTDTLNQLKAKGFLNKIGKGWKMTITGLDYVVGQIAEE